MNDKNIERENTACDAGCDYLQLHPHLAEDVISSFPDDEILSALSELFHMFSDSTRIKILYALDKSEMCVCDLSQVVGMSVSAVSHQLRLLRAASLVKCRRDGKSAVYSLADEHVKIMIENGLTHINE